MLGSDKSFVHSEERTHGPGFRGKFGTTRLSCLVHSIRALKIESVAHQANYAGNDLSSNFDRRKSEIISMITRDNQPLFRIRNSLSLTLSLQQSMSFTSGNQSKFLVQSSYYVSAYYMLFNSTGR